MPLSKSILSPHDKKSPKTEFIELKVHNLFILISGGTAILDEVE